MFENIRSRKRHGQARIEYRACRKEVEEKLAVLGAQVNTGQHPTSSGGRKPRIEAIFVEGSGRIETVILLAGTLKTGPNLIPSFPNLFYCLGSPKNYR